MGIRHYIENEVEAESNKFYEKNYIREIIQVTRQRSNAERHDRCDLQQAREPAAIHGGVLSKDKDK